MVCDNDASQSAEQTVRECACVSPISVVYCVEPRQNIALARNTAVENAHGDFVAFIDDDEFPINTWLLTLFSACIRYGTDGVLGPVKPHFDHEPPHWVVAGKFYDRPCYPTGLIIDWRKGRTGNVLFKKTILSGLEQPFRPEFRTGEDQDCFHRMIARGHSFVWCDEAIAYEVVPPVRWTRRFMLKRYWLRGAMEPKTPGFGTRNITRALSAILAYAVALPLLFVLGQGTFMLYLTKLSYHLGTLLAWLGVNPIKTPYVTS